MMTKIDVIAAILIAFATSYIITPLMAKFAVKIKFVDQPSGRKVHTEPTPLLGGLSIYFSFIAALSFTLHADKALIGALVGGTVLMVVGIIDDKVKLIPRLKLLGQFMAALITVIMGVKVDFITAPFAGAIFTFMWLVGMTNAFNLIDNINGLSAGIAGISAFFFGVLAFVNGDMMIAVVSFSLMGGCFGFLKYNFPRAGIFMGDTGSLFLGFMLASIAVAGSWKTSSVTTSLAIPILILSYPIFDVALVTIMRMLEGRPISMGGKDHSSHRLAIALMESILHSRKKGNSKGTKVFPAIGTFLKGLKKKGDDRSPHRLAALGFKKKRAVLVLYGMSIIFGLAALGMTVLGEYYDWTIMIAAFAVMLVLGARLGMVRIKHNKELK